MKKKYVIGFMIDIRGIFGVPDSKSFYAEDETYKNYVRIIDKLNASGQYDIEIYYLDINHQVIEPETRKIIGYYKEFNFDYIYYMFKSVNFDAFAVKLQWSEPDQYLFLAYDHIAAKNSNMVAKLIYNSDHTNKNYVLSKRDQELLEPEQNIYMYNFQDTVLAPNPDVFLNKNAVPMAIGFHGQRPRFKYVFDYLCDSSQIAIYGSNFENSQDLGDLYKGPVHSDDLLKTVNDCGIILSFHSNPHNVYEMYTNRIFEGICGGAVLITNDFGNLKELFGDNIFTVDINQSKEQQEQ